MVDREVCSGVSAVGPSTDREARRPINKQFGLSLVHRDGCRLDSIHTLSFESAKSLTANVCELKKEREWRGWRS